MNTNDNLNGENPGVLIKVNGRLVPCDEHLRQRKTNTELALNWVSQERTKNRALMEAVYKLMDEVLTIEMVEDYLHEREQKEYPHEEGE